MKVIEANEIIKMVERLCIEANYIVGCDIKHAIKNSINAEESELGKSVLSAILENAEIAEKEQMAICQDTGMAVVFIELGQNVVVTGGAIEDAINEGIRRGYANGYLRKSVVQDPIDRVNTKDNTPAVIHYNVVSGDAVKITVAPKGFGSENMSGLKMLKPSEGIEGVKDFIINTVKIGGTNACPPLIIGVGVGGTMEKAAIMAKRALLRPIGYFNNDKFWASVELELLDKINALGIGPAGFGGRITALGVNIETYPTHIAGLPVAVNIGCHVTRHAEAVL